MLGIPSRGLPRANCASAEEERQTNVSILFLSESGQVTRTDEVKVDKLNSTIAL